ncbi:hypothetical protein ACFQ9H_20445 [Streptomyces sp. NPDC056517]
MRPDSKWRRQRQRTGAALHRHHAGKHHCWDRLRFGRIRLGG